MRTLRCQSKNGVGYHLTSYSNLNKLTDVYSKPFSPPVPTELPR